MNEADFQVYLLTADIDELEHLIYRIECEIQRRENEEIEEV